MFSTRPKEKHGFAIKSETKLTVDSKGYTETETNYYYEKISVED